MNISDALEWYDGLESDLGYKVEKNKNAFAVLLNTLMMEQGIKKAELAQRIGKSAPYVTKVLHGDTNLTIGSMTKLLDAIDCELHINGCRKEHEMKWVSVVSGGKGLATDSRTSELSKIWARQVSHAKEAA